MEPCVKHRTIQLLEANAGENLGDLGFSDYSLKTTSRAQSVKEITDKWDFLKVENFLSAKTPLRE